MYSGPHVDDARANGIAYAAVEGLAVVGFIVQDVVFGSGCADGCDDSSRLLVFGKEGME